jgi:tRNA-dihydrouridine synthase C
VQVQILGGDPEKMAEAASIACGAGALGIDINFGCPAPIVNRHDGGATLLKYPKRLQAIVAAVRAAVPKHLPVSAKLRLGWEDLNDIHHNAGAAAEGGASWITIHGRTKRDGYRPPAYWGPIGEVRRRLGIPVVANGEIWTLEDFQRCRDITGCDHFMLGRGALADPSLQPRVSLALGLEARLPEPVNPKSPDLRDWLPLLRRFSEVCREIGPDDRTNYTLCRLKQWLKIVSSRNPACGWFHDMKRTQTLDDAFAALGAI